MTTKRQLALTLALGAGTAAVVAIQICLPGDSLLRTPSPFLWVALAALVGLTPVKRLMGGMHANLISLIIFTSLVLFGTGTAILAAWCAGFLAVISAIPGNRRADFLSAMQNAGGYAVGAGIAGLVIWGPSRGAAVLDAGLGYTLMVRLIIAYALYLSLKTAIRSLVAGRWEDLHPRDIRIILTDSLTVSAWLVPPAAYLLVLVYLNSSILAVTMLASVLLFHGLTAYEEHESRSSWIRLTDGLRQACDGHVIKHRGETHKVVDLATSIAERMKIPAWNLRLLDDSAALHNIGYIAMDVELVIKPGQLSYDEITAIKQHPECSREILEQVAGMENVAEIVRYHHESPDGSGYPCGLEGDAIPIEAAIIRVAEAYVAMTSPRAYRERPLTKDQALKEIEDGAGHSFDPIVAYHLFEELGREDLASEIARRFGEPERAAVAGRLYTPKPHTSNTRNGTGSDRSYFFQGLALLIGAIAMAHIFNSLGVPRPLGAHTPWFNLDTPGAVFLLGLMGLAMLKPVRLPWGAYSSWAAAVVLSMVLAGGPVYIPISGMAMIAWALLLRSTRLSGLTSMPGDSGPVEDSGISTETPPRTDISEDDRLELHPLRMHERALERIDRYNRCRERLPMIWYSMVLMLAGGSAWGACWLGHLLWGGTLLGLLLSPLLFGVVASVVFYLVETILQAALLARQRPSVSRTWYRNYAAAFPEPFTFAVFGYGVYVVSGLLGIWIGVLIFALPTIWRYKVLASRTRTMRTTRDLLRSIAKTVDLKNGAAAAHASSVAITSVAIARQMGLAEALVEDIENAGILHDLGKASWPSKVLEQRAYLNPKDERYRHVHPDMSARIAMWAGYSESVAAAIRTHHENYDGSGYTRGLKGLAIPLGGRILRLADSFSEMVQTGDPRFARTLPEAVREVRFRSGKQFDPEMVKALLQVLERAVFPEPTPPEGDKPSEMTEPVGARG